MKVRFTPRVLAEAARARRWWTENRPDAPERFDDELDAGIRRIAALPMSGTIYRASLGTLVRRVLLPVTDHHVDYTVTKTEVVLLSVWGTPREQGPSL